MDKDKIIEIGKYLNTKYLIVRNVDKNDKLDKQDKYIQLLYDNYLDLKIINNNLNKGIDKLVNDYKLLLEVTERDNKNMKQTDITLARNHGLIIAYKQVIRNLKKLKGE